MKGGSSGNDDTGENSGRASKKASDTLFDPDRAKFCLDEIVDAISHSTRRQVLEYLATSESEVTLDQLTGEIDQCHATTGPLQGPREERVKTQLYHVHIPKLAKNGLITHDRQCQRVTLTEDGEEVVQLLRKTGWFT